MPDIPGGGYQLPPNSTAVNGTTILAETHNIPVEDIAQALNNRVRRDGQGGMLGDLDLGGFRARNSIPGTQPGDLVTFQQLQDLLTTVASVPTGSLHVTTGTVLPAGYIWANGGSYPRQSHPNLWAWVQAQGSGVLASTQGSKTAGQYGPGNGSTTFTVPDLREYFVRSTSSGRNAGTVQEGAIESHTHTGTTNNDTHTHNMETRGGGGTGVNSMSFNNGFGTVWADRSSMIRTAPDTHNHTFTTSSTGGTETRPKNIAYNYMIKV